MKTTTANISKTLLKKAFRLMATAKAMTEIYEENQRLTSQYVHATSRGHEAAQLALALQLKPYDWVSPYYRDDSILLGIGMKPRQLMLQLLAKRDDPFSGGRLYYSHPSLKEEDKPKIITQTSATGMQAIPATGIALGLRYKETAGLADKNEKQSIVVCSIGDGAMTEGEVSEALHMAALKELPVLFFVQDNDWDISAHHDEIHIQTAYDFSKGFPGIEAHTIDGSDFIATYSLLEDIIKTMRKERRPFLLRMEVPLLNHHTSGVRMEWYRDDLEEARQRDPYPRLRADLAKAGISEKEIQAIENAAREEVRADFEWAVAQPDPKPEDLYLFDFAPTPVTEEKGQRSPQNGEEKVMVDCALFAMEEILRKHPEALFYGQDVGRRLGGVFREAATLAQKFGDHRVFNTPIQEAFIVGSTVGMSAAGLKPIVEVQFADYIWPGLNQLFTEVSRSYYLSMGKWPVQMVLRVPIGAYGRGGPYHSSSVESVVTNIRGIKVAYPSNGADLKGLLKAAFYDPNPVVMFEHKGLYWSKAPGTEAARCIVPDEDYVVPFGKCRTALQASEAELKAGRTALVVTYGMGVHWALNAAKNFPGQIEVLDLRTLVPLDEEGIYEAARRHGRILVLTEEPVNNTFAQSVAARIQENCFEYLDAPVRTLGAENLPAIPLNATLEAEMIPSAEKVGKALEELLKY